MKHTVEVHRTQWPRVVALALLCPAMLAVAVAIVPRFTWLYGTVGEFFLYAFMLALPFIGAAGILRFARTSRWIKWLAALSYLAVAEVLVAAAALIIGCSLAGACF